MKNNKHLNFEKLSLIDTSKLIGGFSIAFYDCQKDTAKINNCQGGNLKTGCGANHKNGKSTGHSSNGNCKGNCVKGCGNKK